MPFQFQIQPQNNALQQIETLDRLDANRLKRDQFLQSQKDRAEIKRLSPAALDGDKAALSGIAGINPELAFKFSEAYGKLDDQRRKKVEAGTEVAARVSQAALAARSPQEAAAIWDEGFKRAAAEIDPALASELGKFSPNRANFTMRRALAVKDVIDWTLKNANQDVQLADPLNPAAGTRINKDKIRFAGAESGARTGASAAAQFNADQRRAGFDVEQAGRRAAATAWGGASAPHMAGDNVVIPSEVVAGQRNRAAAAAPAQNGATFDMAGAPPAAQPQTTGVYSTGSNTKQMAQANQLRDEYNTLTKDFRTVQDAHAKIKSAASSGTGAGDMAMLYAFVKLLDPGSVVRESEFATAAASGSFGERVQGAVQRIITGERLPDSLRADFLREADGIYRSQQAGYARARDQYGRLADKMSIPRDLVLPDYNQNSAAAPSAAATTATPITGAPPPPPDGYVIQK